MTRARYDGMADWYDETVAIWSATATPLLLRLAGPGPGTCLDVGCRTGVHLAALAGAGWSVVGLDASADQLRLARPRSGPPRVALVQADATALPFPDGARVVHPGYRTPGRLGTGPGTVPGGLTTRVGFRHLPVAALLTSVLDSGLALDWVEEVGDSGLPDQLALVARRHGWVVRRTTAAPTEPPCDGRQGWPA